MNRHLLPSLALVLAGALALAASSSQPVVAAGENLASAKATAQVGDIGLVSGPLTSGASEGEWTTVMSSRLKTSNMKDLFVDVSLETSLFTETNVKSKGGTRDTSTSQGQIEVQVLVDGQPAHPGVVVFDRRVQTLTAVFQGILTDSIILDPTTGLITIDLDTVEPEEVGLLLDTMQAGSFNFIAQDVSSGIHTIEVQARIDLGVTVQAGDAVAKAAVGKGSVTVEEIRLIKDAEIVID